MDKTHYERRSHEQGNYEITPTYTDQVVVTIKSLATGQTMKVYLDEPTQSVNKNGINVTTYTGHFYEEEFMVTWSDGIEITGLPLMYPYPITSSNGGTIVIDTQNHSLTWTNNNVSGQQNIAANEIQFAMMDGETQSASENVVAYRFSRFDTTPSTPTDPSDR